MSANRRHFIGSTLAAGAAAAVGRAWANEAPPEPIALRLVANGQADGTLGYGDPAGRPALRIRHGDSLAVTLENRLTVPTGLRWFGLRGAPASAPPGEAPTVAPGATATITVRPPDPGLYWFGAPAVAGRPDQAGAGLFGTLIVEEAAAPPVDRDLLLVLATPGDDAAPTVNGAPAPLRATVAPGARLRLRLLNASTTRILSPVLEGAQPKIIALDGQPSDLFAPFRGTVPLGPGARCELMLDMERQAGATLRVLLRGTGEPAGPNTLLAELTAAGEARSAPSAAIAALPPNPALPPAIALEAAARAECVIAAMGGSGATRWRLAPKVGPFDPGKPLLSLRRGRPATLGLTNTAAEPVPLRVQGQAMRLLHARDDGWEPYWRDGVVLLPGTTTHLAFKPEAPGRWLVESAAFAQAVAGLRGFLEVT